MKTAITFLAIIISFGLNAQKVNWMSWDEAVEANKQNPKLIFVDVYTDWCGWCKKMDASTFGNPVIAKYMSENYYAVKFNGEGTEPVTYNNFTYTNPNYQPERKGRNAQHFFADALKINAYPSLVFFTETGAVIQAIPGYRTETDFLKIFLERKDYWTQK